MRLEITLAGNSPFTLSVGKEKGSIDVGGGMRAQSTVSGNSLSTKSVATDKGSNVGTDT